MKPSLQFKMSQQLAMTPQLQQAIKLLQLSTLELQQEIQQALAENPLLELEQSDAEGEVSIPQETWEPSYSAGIGQASYHYDGEDQPYEGETGITLHDHLMWQLQLSPFTPTDALIAVAIIEAIDDSGYLTVPLSDIVAGLNEHHVEPIELDEAQVVLKRIQHFDPVGVGARNVAECLTLQLQHLAPDTPWRTEALRAVQEFIDLLATRDYRNLARKLRVNETELAAIVALIQDLNPRPGESFQAAPDNYVIPDVIVSKKNHRWVVELNPETVPKLKVNQYYLDLCHAVAQTDEVNYIRQHAQDAKWFIRSIESRNETLLKVASAIVQRQQAFFEHGEEAMKPMILADIAAAIDMHESTISRVTTQKYMHSPRGVFELKYFFSSQLATAAGDEASSTAIRALLKKFIAAENPRKPLSDSKLTELLAEQGIQVARRTIAKYREALNIPPSSQRKRLI